MSMMSIHAEALCSPSTAYHEFLLRYRACEKSVYGIVEGKDDVSYYRSWIESQLPPGWSLELIGAGNRDKVLSALSVFDWSRFSRHRICFFVDRDLCDLLQPEDTVHENLYVTDDYSVETAAVSIPTFRRILVEVLGVPNAEANSPQAEQMFVRNLDAFCEAMLPVMAQIVLWQRSGRRPCLSDIRPKAFCEFRGGELRLRSCVESVTSRIGLAAESVGLEASPENEVIKTATELSALGQRERYIRGKYLMWFFVECVLEFHRMLPSLYPHHSQPTKVKLSLGLGNATVAIAPRVRCPVSLQCFMNETYKKYIRETAAWASLFVI